METSSNSSGNSDNQSFKADIIQNQDKAAAGLPIAVNPHHVSSDNNSSGKSNRNLGSESE